MIRAGPGSKKRVVAPQDRRYSPHAAKGARTMWQRPFYHEGMSELQDRFDGRRVAEAIEGHRKHYEFWDDEKAMIETSPLFFRGTSRKDYIHSNNKSSHPSVVKGTGPNIIL